MEENYKAKKGGFTATLSIIISIIALILSIIAFNRTGADLDLKKQIKELQTKLENVKQESASRLEKIRKDTADTIERLSQAIRKE
jgi:hypothetical protein